MDDSLLLLKWDNHDKVFLESISWSYIKSLYTDVTIFCDGKYYRAHKLFLSASSDYFKEILDRIECTSSVIILTDIPHKHMDYIFQYIYMGKIEVLHAELYGLIKTADKLKIKGLYYTSDDPECKNKSLNHHSMKRKRRRKITDCETPEKQAKIAQCDTASQDSKESSDISIINPNSSDMCEEIVICSETVVGSKEKIDSDSAVGPKISNNSNSAVEPKNRENSDVSQSNKVVQAIYAIELSDSSSDHSDNEPVVNSKAPLNKYQCTYCPEVFFDKTKLKVHCKVHAGEKPFRCEHCDFRTNMKGRLKMHFTEKHNNVML